MLTLYWPGFPALMNWLWRGETEDRREAPPPTPQAPMEREKRWADEAAALPSAQVRWGNFR
jgi:hypothetical protein